MNEEPSGKLGRIRVKWSDGIVSGVPTFKLRYCDRSNLGNTLASGLGAPGMTSCIIIPPVLLTMLLL